MVSRSSVAFVSLLLTVCAPARPPTSSPAPRSAASAGSAAKAASSRPYRPGIEVLLSDSIHLIRGKRVGLITNHTGTLRDGRSSIDALAHAPGVKLTALFAPEHGIRGAAAAGETIASSVDSATGVPIYSLYGKTHVPTDEMLKDVDVVLYDIQDIGSRTYTFEWTMALSAEAVKRKFVVLDRPNPIRGDIVEGGVLDPKFRSFVGQYPVALRYGLTAGELLRYLVGSGQVKADIAVVPMDGWRRDMWWTDTNQPWHNPSPNIRSLDAAILYPGAVLLEGTNLTERGTPIPFQIAGAPWLTDAGAIARALNAKRIPGVVFDSTLVTMEAGFKYPGQRIPAIAIAVAERDSVRAVATALQLLREIYRRHPNDFTWRTEHFDRLAGDERMRRAIQTEGAIEKLIPELDAESRRFAEAVAPYLIY